MTPQESCYAIQCIGNSASAHPQDGCNLPVSKPLRPQVNALPVAFIQLLDARGDPLLALVLLEGLFWIRTRVHQPLGNIV